MHTSLMRKAYAASRSVFTAKLNCYICFEFNVDGPKLLLPSEERKATRGLFESRRLFSQCRGSRCHIRFLTRQDNFLDVVDILDLRPGPVGLQRAQRSVIDPQSSVFMQRQFPIMQRNWNSARHNAQREGSFPAVRFPETGGLGLLPR